MRLIIIIGLLLISYMDGKACINYYYAVDQQGHLHHMDDLQRPFNTNFNKRLIDSKLRKLAKQLAKEQDYKLLSDYAVLLLKGGKAKEALAILEQLSRHYPDEYQITANLGTVYEVNGQNEKALTFIKKGIALNPDAHGGSEWIHVKILETKLQLEKDKGYLSSGSVLGLNTEQKADTLVRNQLLLQVRERFPFSPGPNAIMSSLLIDLGDCFASTASIEFAKVVYTIAKRYYGADKQLTDNKIAEMVRLRGKYKSVRPERKIGPGDNVKLSAIRYVMMLDDNDPTKHQINWSKIEVNTDSLLNLVNLERVALLQKAEVTDTATIASLNQDTPLPKEANTAGIPNLPYYLSGLLLLLLVVFFIYRKTRA